MSLQQVCLIVRRLNKATFGRQMNQTKSRLQLNVWIPSSTQPESTSKLKREVAATCTRPRILPLPFALQQNGGQSDSTEQESALWTEANYFTRRIFARLGRRSIWSTIEVAIALQDKLVCTENPTEYLSKVS